MEIKVVVPDAFAASDLTWHLDGSARVSRADGIDGTYVVYAESSKEPRHVLEEIRNWATVNRITPVVVHLGEGTNGFVTQF